MVHVLYVLKRFPRLSQTFVLNELLALERLGVRVSVVALRRSDEPHGRYADLRAPVFYLAERDRPAQDVGQQAEQVAELVRHLDVTHMHAHFATRAATVARLVSTASSIPYSFTAHAHDIFHSDVDTASLAATIEQASFVVTVSDYNRAYLEALLLREGRSGHVLRIYNGVDLQALRPAQQPTDPQLIVSVGRLTAKKGFADLIEALRLLHAAGQPYQCSIIGEGEQRAALTHQITQAGLATHVHLLGAQPPELVAQLVSSAAMFALPCVVGADGDRDGMPTVLVEAMALGVPVVSSAIVGIPELVRHRVTGMLVPEANPPALATALAQLGADTRLRNRLRAAALLRIQADFDLDRNVAMLARAFAQQMEHVWAM